MSEMPAAFTTQNLNPVHPKTVIIFKLKLSIPYCVPETWPSAPRVILCVGGKKCLTTPRAFINTVIKSRVILSRKGRLGRGKSHYLILLWCELFFPVFFGFILHIIHKTIVAE